MKKNLPVFDTEINYPDDSVFVTKTDTKGIITYANDSFVEISGFSREELIGVNHNIVRHPDMPEWAFADLWKTVNGGHPWRGIVKNRAKSGQYYWVRATVSPIVNHGKVVGYISLRKKPTKEEVAAATRAYKSNVPPQQSRTLATWFRDLPLQSKMQLLIQPVFFLMLGGAILGISNHTQSSMVYSAQSRAEGIANEVIDSANMLMVTGRISEPDTRKLLLKKISSSGNIVGLRLFRSEQVVQQFGAGLPEEAAMGDIERNVLASGKPHYQTEQRDGRTIFRAITPYTASRDFHGTDCLSCHNVAQGSVLGASDIEIDLSKDVSRVHSVITALIIGQVAFQLFLFFFIGWVISRFIVKPVEDIKSHLSDVVNCDMNRQVEISGRDEMGEILCSVQSSKVLLGAICDQIKSVATQLESRAILLSETINGVETSSRLQSEAASSMAAAVEELTVSINQVAENASDVHHVSVSSKSAANDGGKIVQQVAADMSDIHVVVTNTSTAVQQLGARSTEIQSIVNTIQELADQTNLLALNAAIEAARAGENGRGFAVVADEVRKLAEKTTRSTHEISAMTLAISESTRSAVVEMNITVEKVKSGTDLAKQAGDAIIEIDLGAHRVQNGIQDITSSISEQSAVAQDIAANVERVARMSENNSGAMSEVSNTVDNLRKYSHELALSVAHFHI